MTCKDCIYYDVCQYHIDEETDMTVVECGKFKNKSDFVEVVRCKKCIYADKHYDTTHLIGNTYFPSGMPTKLLYITCKYHEGKLAEGDFCSYGERGDIMATFMLTGTVVCVKADKLTYEDESVLAWDGENISAVFKLEEIMGCYWEEAMV